MISNQTIKNRAKIFDDIIGQPGVIGTFKTRALKKDWSTAMLLSGPSGTGKTTSAYLIAMSINCLKPLSDGNPCLTCPSCRSILDETFTRDTKRLRSDSTGGKGEVQDFFMEVDSRPLYDKKKVYIIEESDQLSTAAKNSLHTILESPREHLHFILISMVANGIPASIKGRCQTFTFNRLNIADTMLILKNILEKNNLWSDPSVPKEFKFEGLKLIASCSMGSAREAIQNLEKCIVGNFFTLDKIKENIEKVSIEQHTENLILSLLKGKKEDFYSSIARDFDIMEFLRLGYYMIARAIIYRETGECDYDSREGMYKTLIASSNFKALSDFFRNFSKTASAFIRLGDFVMLSDDYFRGWKASIPMRGVK